MIVVAGAGYVGGRLAGQLEAMGQAVTALTRSGGAGTRACDITNLRDLRGLAEELGEVDSVVLAASSGRGGAAAYRAVFIEGTRALLETLAPRRFLLTSSTSVYAQGGGELVDENSPAEPRRETGEILLEAEALARAAGGTVLRLSGIYGPGRSVVLRRYLQGRAGIDGDPAADPAAAGRHLNQIHRDDAASALQHVLQLEGAGGEIFNVTDDRPISQRALYAALDARFGKGIPAVRPPDPGGKRGWSNKRVSNRKLRATGWAPRYASYLHALDADPELVPSIEAQLGAGA